MAMTIEEIKQKLKEADPTTDPTAISWEQFQMWQKLSSFNKRSNMHSILECPHCGSNYTHHLGVEMFGRNEDQHHGDHITMYERYSHGWGLENIIIPDHSVDGDLTNNPSERRTGINIILICENCHKLSKLGISQNRGETHIGWNNGE